MMASDTHASAQLPWLEPGAVFPPIAQSWGASDPAPGLLAAGAALDIETLCQAYRHGIFPWFSEGQPILWWSPDPRMVLKTADFKLHRSLAKTLKKFIANDNCSLLIDTAFGDVIRACATRPRGTTASDGAADTGPGTWILPDMVAAYEALHRMGFAHSVEVWINQELVGGLYCVAIGQAVFGESMFSRSTDASKIALAGLVALSHAQGVELIDCQQNTPHLASLGAREIDRVRFALHVERACQRQPLNWQFENVYWNRVLQSTP